MKKILFFIALLGFLSLIYADFNGVWNRAEDLRGGILGEDENGGTNTYMVRDIHVGTVTDWDDNTYKIKPSENSNLNNLTVESGNIVNNCFEKVDTNYQNLACDSNNFANNAEHNGTHWILTCCYHN